MALIFQIGISRNTKCALKDGFRKSSHIYKIYIAIAIILYLKTCGMITYICAFKVKKPTVSFSKVIV